MNNIMTLAINDTIQYNIVANEDDEDENDILSGCCLSSFIVIINKDIVR